MARLQVTDADLSRLKPGTWLNDEIVNFYGQLILERSEVNPRNKGMKNGARCEKNMILNVHYFNSFFFEKLSQEGYEKARLAKWTKKVRYLFLPASEFLISPFITSLICFRKTLLYYPLTMAIHIGRLLR